MSQGSRFVTLVCLSCGKSYPLQTQGTCTSCGGVLSSKYDLENLDLKIERGRSIWDFRNLLPPVSQGNIVSLGEGFTPYIETKKMANSIGIKELFCKLEGCNPSGSFKDRVASLGLSLSKEWGKKGVFTASSGNAAAAVSSYAARASVPALILIREDSTIAKLSQILMYSPILLRVRGLFENQSSLMEALQICQKALPEWFNHFVWSPVNPVLTDALKTIAYEISLGDIPDSIFVPTAGGDLVHGIFSGFVELEKLGLVDVVPKMVVVQGENADPTVQAIAKGSKEVEPTRQAETVAGALRVNFGASHTLHAVRESNGFGLSVSDQEIIDAQRKVAKLEGIFTEVSSAAALAAASKARSENLIDKDERAAAILTGAGFKDYLPPFHDISEIPLTEDRGQIPLVLGPILRDRQADGWETRR